MSVYPVPPPLFVFSPSRLRLHIYASPASSTLRTAPTVSPSIKVFDNLLRHIWKMATFFSK
jgi:hypothetical protein